MSFVYLYCSIPFLFNLTPLSFTVVSDICDGTSVGDWYLHWSTFGCHSSSSTSESRPKSLRLSVFVFKELLTTGNSYTVTKMRVNWTFWRHRAPRSLLTGWPKMKRSRASCDGETSRQNGSAGPRTGDQQQSDGEEGGSGFGPTDLQSDDNASLRREIRSKYRDLINSVQRE